MKFYILFFVISRFYMGTSIKIGPELQRNILNFGYGINYKYEGMLVHSFDKFMWSLSLCCLQWEI